MNYYKLYENNYIDDYSTKKFSFDIQDYFERLSWHHAENLL